MLPQNAVSSLPITTPFIGGAAGPARDITDYEMGGVAIQNPSEGLEYQIWRARILNDGTEIVLDAREVDAYTIITGTNITEVSLAFDQNMRPVIAYVESGTAKLCWYDSSQGVQVTTSWPGVITPQVSLDDKRPIQPSASDVIFAYLRSVNGEQRLYYRQQRDRYTVEYDPMQALYDEMISQGYSSAEAQAVYDDYQAKVAASAGLVKIGMSKNLRFQFMTRGV
ncbi:hypothetical protein [Microbulbifer sp. SSSA005]|uniref:hypothetical protein n=1 Tax=Microbulbifer sp. SSSA005 TaxID=3243378 RepID=UPI00403A23E3